MNDNRETLSLMWAPTGVNNYFRRIDPEGK